MKMGREQAHWLPEGAADPSPWMERSAILGKLPNKT
jgi:hypothetical protein